MESQESFAIPSQSVVHLQLNASRVTFFVLLTAVALALPARAENWTTLPGSATAIAANAKGDVWAIGTEPSPGGYKIWRWNHGAWQNIAGGAVRIAVDPDGTAWVVTSTGAIFHSNESGQWMSVPGTATDIAVGAKGDLWALGTARVGNDYGVWHAVVAPGTRNVTSWQPVSGAAARIAVDAEGNPWVVTRTGVIYHLQGGHWIGLGGMVLGEGKAISLGPDGVLYAVGPTDEARPGGFTIFRYQNSKWQALNVGGIELAAGAAGTVYVVQNSSNRFAILSNSGLPTATYAVAAAAAPPAPPVVTPPSAPAKPSAAPAAPTAPSTVSGPSSKPVAQPAATGTAAASPVAPGTVATSPAKTATPTTAAGTAATPPPAAPATSPATTGAAAASPSAPTTAAPAPANPTTPSATAGQTASVPAPSTTVAPSTPPPAPNGPSPSSEGWTTLPGAAMDIGANAKGSIWVIGTNSVQGGYAVYQWVNSNWQNVPGGGLRVSVDPDGSAWLVNNTGNIFHSSVTPSRAAAPTCDETRRPLQHCTTASAPAPQVQWTTQSGSATDIAVGANGDVWIIGTDRSGNDYGIYKAVFASGTRNVSSWQKVDGGAVRIAVGPDGSPWVVNSSGNVYNRVDGGWAQLAINGITDISIGPDGTPYLTANGQGGSGAVMRLMPSGMNPSAPGAMAWIPVPFSNLAATNVAAAAPGTVYVTRDSANQNAILSKNGLPVASSTLASNAQPWSLPATPAPGIVNASSGPCAAGYKLEGTTCVQDCPPNYSDKDDNTCGRTMTAYAPSGGACKPGAHLWAGSLCVQDCPPGMKEQNLFCMKNCYPSGGSASAATSCTAKAGSVAATPGSVASPTPPPQTGASLGSVTTLPAPPGGGGASDIGANASGDVWIISSQSGGSIYRLVNGKWQNVPGGAVRVSVDPDGTAWVVNGGGQIFHSTSSTPPGWTLLQGAPGATDIGVGANGDVWIIGADRSGNDYDIYKAVFASGSRKVSSWQKVDGAAVRIAVGPDGTAWIANSSGTLFYRQNNTWSQVTATGGVKDVSVGPDGTPIVVNGRALVALWPNQNATLPGTSAWLPKLFSSPPAINVAAAAAGTVYVTQDSSNQNAILSLGGLPVIQPPANTAASSQSQSATSDQSQGQTVATGFDYCWKDSHGRGVGQPLSMSSSDCPGGTVKDPTGLMCYPSCKAGYSMVGPVCWENCPSGYTDTGADCAKPNSSYGNGVGYVFWDQQKCNNEHSQGCFENAGMWYPNCNPGYVNIGGNICSPKCPSDMTDTGAFCHKNSYGNGVGQTLGCPAGTEQSGLLCYPSCGSNASGVGPVCYDNCPSGWVQCGAGCAKDTATCAVNTSQQVLSIVQAVVQIAITAATLGTATPVVDAARAGEEDALDKLAQQFADNSDHPGSTPDKPNGPSTPDTEPSPHQPPAGNPNPQAGLATVADQFNAEKTQIDTQLDLIMDQIIKEPKGGAGISRDTLIAEKSQLDSQIQQISSDIQKSAISPSQLQSDADQLDAQMNQLILQSEDGGAGKLADTLEIERTQLDEEIYQKMDESGGSPAAPPASPSTVAGDTGKLFDFSDSEIEQQVQKIGADRSAPGRYNLMKASVDDANAQVAKIGQMSKSEIADLAEQAREELYGGRVPAGLPDRQSFDVAVRIGENIHGAAGDPSSAAQFVDDLSFYRWYLVKCRKVVLDALAQRARDLGDNTSALTFTNLSSQVESFSNELDQWVGEYGVGWINYLNPGEGGATYTVDIWKLGAGGYPPGETPGLPAWMRQPTPATAAASPAPPNPFQTPVADSVQSVADERTSFANKTAVNNAATSQPSPSSTNRQVHQVLSSLQTMTPDQKQRALSVASQQVNNLNLSQTNLPPVSTQQLQNAFVVAQNNTSSSSASSNSSYSVVTVTAAPNNNSATPMAPPSLVSLLPIQDVVNKIQTATSPNSGLTTDQKNMQIAMASLEGAAALDPTGVVGIISAYTKPLCSLVTQNTGNNPVANTPAQPVAQTTQPQPPPQAYTTFMNLSAGYIQVLSSAQDAASLQTAQPQIQAVAPQYTRALAQLQGATLTSAQQAAVASQQQQVSAQLARVRSLPGGTQATRKKLPGDD